MSSQITDERLAELLSANESAARGKDWLHRDTEDYVDTAAAMRELQDLRALQQSVTSHNQACASLCEQRRKAGHCDPYTHRGRQCPDCPLDDVID